VTLRIGFLAAGLLVCGCNTLPGTTNPATQQFDGNWRLTTTGDTTCVTIAGGIVSAHSVSCSLAATVSGSSATSSGSQVTWTYTVTLPVVGTMIGIRLEMTAQADGTFTGNLVTTSPSSTNAATMTRA
jgi:hypothetical protein